MTFRCHICRDAQFGRLYMLIKLRLVILKPEKIHRFALYSIIQSWELIKHGYAISAVSLRRD
jgi:hypothetical protein